MDKNLIYTSKKSCFYLGRRKSVRVPLQFPSDVEVSLQGLAPNWKGGCGYLEGVEESCLVASKETNGAWIIFAT